jgi:DNA-binding response OmpR family regulator
MEQLCSLIKASDFRVQTATDLESTQQRLATARFPIVIVDWQLPNEGARQVVSLIRGNHRLRRTHIVALSEPASAEFVEAVLQTGVDDFISRPISASEVRNRLLWAMSQYQKIV